MNGREVFRHAVTRLAEAVDEALAANDLTRSAMSTGWCRIRPTAASSMPWAASWVFRPSGSSSPWTAMPTPPRPRCRWRWPRRGVTGASSAGQLVLLEALGGGLTWGSALVRMYGVVRPD